MQLLSTLARSFKIRGHLVHAPGHLGGPMIPWSPLFPLFPLLPLRPRSPLGPGGPGGPEGPWEHVPMFG